MGVTEEGTSMIDENKKKDGLPTIKVRGLFCFGVQPNPVQSEILIGVLY